MARLGIYEQVINNDLAVAIANESDLQSFVRDIDEAEAPKVLSSYLAAVLEKELSSDDLDGNINGQIKLVNAIIDVIGQATGEAKFGGLIKDNRAEQLLALIDKRNTIYSIDEKAGVTRPETSIAKSSLFTGAVHEPSMVTELKKEIVSSDRIDMLVSFIKWSGLRLLMDELIEFTHRGGRLRVITTSYMGATDVKAIEQLSKLANTEIKVSYDTKRTRLHAKTYVFSGKPASAPRTLDRPIYRTQRSPAVSNGT